MPTPIYIAKWEEWKPMGEPFKVLLDSSWFKEGDLITKGKPKWWQILLQIITLGLYKPNKTYKVINEPDFSNYSWGFDKPTETPPYIIGGSVPKDNPI